MSPLWKLALEKNLLYSSHHPSFCSLKDESHFNAFFFPQQEAVPADLIKSTLVSLMQWIQSIVLFFNTKKNHLCQDDVSCLSLHLTPVLDPLAFKK